jgi:hypothetical protein
MEGAEPNGVVEAIGLLRDDGYVLDFPGGHDVSCSVSSTEEALGALQFERVYRFEGVSDPGDEAIVLGVRCPSCGGRGVVVSAYGPGAPDPAFLTGFVDHRGEGARS